MLLPAFVQNSMKHSYFSSHLAFSLGVLLEFEWCNHTIVLTQLQLGRILPLFYQRSDIHRVDSFSIVVHALSLHMLILLSVDEILLPRYMNWSTKLRGFGIAFSRAYIVSSKKGPFFSVMSLQKNHRDSKQQRGIVI